MLYEQGSFITVPNQKTIRGIDPKAQCLYMWLCFHANQAGTCFPSRKLLMEETGMSLTSVKDAIKTLEGIGVIKATRRKSGKENLTNFYEVMIGGVGRNTTYLGRNTTQGVGRNTTRELNPLFLTKSNKESEKKIFSHSLEEISEKLPNTAIGSLPEITHRPPMEIKHEKQLERRLSGMYDNTFGSKAVRVVKHFCSLYQKKYGRQYGSIVKVDMVAKNISTYFKEGETETSLKNMLNAYFESEKSNSLPVKLTTAFSEDTYRAWTQDKLKPADGSASSEESVYPMDIQGLTVRSDSELFDLYKRGIVVETEKGSGKWILTENGREVMKHG